MYEGGITINVDADLQQIERLNQMVRQFGELHNVPGRTLYAINLAIDELVSNIVLHGYEDPNGKQITVQIEGSDGELRATITDAGREFNPLSVPRPDLDAPLEKRTLGGLGIHLVRSLTDRVEYARTGEKNVLTVAKRIR